MRITIFTGTRAEFGLLQPVMRACEAMSRDVRFAAEPTRCEWLASGMHLVPSMGDTIRAVREDGAPILAEVPFFDAARSHAANVGAGVAALAEALAKAGRGEQGKPDWLVVLGDRYESFAATVAATLSGIPVCHIHGGDRANSGHIDETFRHSMTRFAALHCAATRTSHERILKFGEEPWRAHWVGGPGIDRLRVLRSHDATVAAANLFRRENPRGLLLVILHPVSTEAESAGAQAEWLCRELDTRPEIKLCVLPNNDPGGEAIRAVMKSFEGRAGWKVVPNLGPHEYAAALSVASAFIGNSSSGIIEAPLFGLPMVHVGNRNRGREHAGHVTWVEWGVSPGGLEKESGDSADAGAALHAAIDTAITPSEHARVAALGNPYGDGRAGERIAELLWAFRGNGDLLRKMVTY